MNVYSILGLEAKPLVVLSNKDGCVIASSNEVKALGINMAQPDFQIEKVSKDNKVDSNVNSV
jgi:DNA polymerase V